MVQVKKVTYVCRLSPYLAHLDLELALWANFEIDLIGSKLI